MIDLQSARTSSASALTALALFVLQVPVATATDNPFTAIATDDHALIASEGMSRCGGAMDKCGSGMDKHDGAKKSGKKQCKMLRMDSNGDGKVSREEFMTAHEAMFDKMDSNGDGVLDKSELGAHKGMQNKEMKGKCGQAKDRK